MTVEQELGRLVKTELVELLARRAVKVGLNPGRWPGLALYRFTSRVTPHWDEVRSLSLCMVAQGRKRVRIGSVDYFYDPFHYLVMTRGLRFQAEILQGSPEVPFLSFVLQVQPDLVTEIYDAILEQTPEACRIEPVPTPPGAYVSPLDRNLLDAVHRFLGCVESDTDRSVLGAIYLREIVYRLLRCEQRDRLLDSAVREANPNVVTAAIRYMRQEMRRPLTVAEIAAAVCMSESGFAHLFKAATGSSPLRFLKQLRIEQARLLLLSGYSVSQTANEVGYCSLSHFVSEFKRQFDQTPRAYAQQIRQAKVGLADAANA